MYKYSNRQRGFTLIELLVVIVIIGLLATIALPKFSGVKEDANIAVTKSNLKSLQTALERYQLDHGEYPDELAALVTDGYIQKKSCLIPTKTEAYQYGAGSDDYLAYDSIHDVYVTTEGVQDDYLTYGGGISPTAQTL